MVVAYGVLAGDGGPHIRTPTGWGDGESCPGSGRCLWSACKGMEAPNGLRQLAWDMGNLAPSVVVAYIVSVWN